MHFSSRQFLQWLLHHFKLELELHEVGREQGHPNGTGEVPDAGWFGRLTVQPIPGVLTMSWVRGKISFLWREAEEAENFLFRQVGQFQGPGGSSLRSIWRKRAHAYGKWRSGDKAIYDSE